MAIFGIFIGNDQIVSEFLRILNISEYINSIIIYVPGRVGHRKSYCADVAKITAQLLKYS
jgi:hypothetical protein